MKKHITINQIAAEAGVNRSTVSRALNPVTASRISQEVRTRILTICDRHFYRPRTSGKALACGQTYCISLILGAMPVDFLAPNLAEFITGLSMGVQDLGYVLTLLHLDYHSPDPEARLREFLLSDRSDGYILGASMLTEETEQLIQGLHIPIVSLNQLTSSRFPIPSVILDNSGSFTELLRQLPEEFAGHSLFLGAEGPQTTCKWQMIQSCLSQLGLSDDFFAFRTFLPAEKGIHVGRRNGVCFAEANLDFLSQFRFIWCAADLTAFGVADVLRNHHIEPGRDIFLAGYDNIEGVFNSRSPFLTTIDPCMKDCGLKTAKYIVEGIQAPESLASNLITSSEFIRRSSFPKVHFS